jgi:antitoxin MazE
MWWPGSGEDVPSHVPDFTISAAAPMMYSAEGGFHEARMRVAKWGNGLAVRLPWRVVKALGLKEGDCIEVHVVGPRNFEIERRPTPRELLSQLRKFRGRLPAGFRFDRLRANERR